MTPTKAIDTRKTAMDLIGKFICKRDADRDVLANRGHMGVLATKSNPRTRQPRRRADRRPSRPLQSGESASVARRLRPRPRHLWRCRQAWLKSLPLPRVRRETHGLV